MQETNKVVDDVGVVLWRERLATQVFFMQEPLIFAKSMFVKWR